MGVPLEVVANPLTVWVAPTGTDFPNVDAAPDGDWFLLGTSGAANYEDAGVTVTHDQTITTWTPAARTMPRRIWRTAEGFSVAFSLTDISSAQYAKTLNDATVTQIAAGSGTPGYDSIELYQGLTVAVFALLARGLSPFDESMAAQYQVYQAYQGANQAPVYTKGTPATLAITLSALFDEDNDGVGQLIIQTAVSN